MIRSRQDQNVILTQHVLYDFHCNTFYSLIKQQCRRVRLTITSNKRNFIVVFGLPAAHWHIYGSPTCSAVVSAVLLWRTALVLSVVIKAALLCLFWHVNGRHYGHGYCPPGEKEVLTTWRNMLRVKTTGEKYSVWVWEGGPIHLTWNFKDPKLIKKKPNQIGVFLWHIVLQLFLRKNFPIF